MQPAVSQAVNPRFHGGAQDASKLPDNEAMSNIAEALAVGARAEGSAGGVVLMVVQPGERNAYDQQVGVAGRPLCRPCGRSNGPPCPEMRPPRSTCSQAVCFCAFV
jgi:hypothetical protein